MVTGLAATLPAAMDDLPRTTADLAADAEAARRLLAALAAEPSLMAELPDAVRIALREACGRLARPSVDERHAYRKAKRRRRRQDRREARETTLGRAGIRRQRAALVYPTPAPAVLPGPEAAAGTLPDARVCYICKAEYTELHHFYDALCPACAAFNWAKRHQTADLTDRVALLTGGRVKIGYQAGIKLLRAGATLIVTTRFPRDAATRYAAEPDAADWTDRLSIHGLDLRHTPSVEALARHLEATRPRLDFILNNACQTVRRPPGFYAHLMAGEAAPCDALPAARAPDPVGLTLSAALSQVPLVPGDADPDAARFPAGRLDADLQQLDLRDVNSWRLALADVPTVELLEVHLVNAVAPFVLNARLKPLMVRTPGRAKHIVNVSAMEGQFYRTFKTDKHPHTNMAKAALNMLTRTSAADYVRDGIHMNSVDTGWITDEDPAHLTLAKQVEHGFHPPLDHVDAAARICDPIFDGLNTDTHVWGQFLKDYRPAPW